MCTHACVCVWVSALWFAAASKSLLLLLLLCLLLRCLLLLLPSFLCCFALSLTHSLCVSPRAALKLQLKLRRNQPCTVRQGVCVWVCLSVERIRCLPAAFWLDLLSLLLPLLHLPLRRICCRCISIEFLLLLCFWLDLSEMGVANAIHMQRCVSVCSFIWPQCCAVAFAYSLFSYCLLRCT